MKIDKIQTVDIALKLSDLIRIVAALHVMEVMGTETFEHKKDSFLEKYLNSKIQEFV